MRKSGKRLRDLLVSLGSAYKHLINLIDLADLASRLI